MDWFHGVTTTPLSSAFGRERFALLAVETPTTSRYESPRSSPVMHHLVDILGMRDSTDTHFFGAACAPDLYRVWQELHARLTSSSCLVKPTVSFAAANAASLVVASA